MNNPEPNLIVNQQNLPGTFLSSKPAGVLPLPGCLGLGLCPKFGAE